MTEALGKLRDDHNKLYSRVRDNETKYMPAVEAAFKALEKAEALKLELHDRVNNLSAFDGRQELKMEYIIKRLDSSDEIRKAHLDIAIETSNSLENHMIKEEKDRKFAINLTKYIFLPVLVLLLTYMGWLGEQQIEVQKQLAIVLEKQK